MSKTTEALEALVSKVIESRAPEGSRPTPRQRLETDRAFAAILKLIAPRIRHFIRQYGLVAHWDDAEQVAAIAVHRAIEAYDSEKAQFTTFVNWQIRGEMQGLRFRLMTDQRSSAKKVEATTVSLDSIVHFADGESVGMETMIEDTDALERVEAGASEYLARSAMEALATQYVKHQRQVEIGRLHRKVKSTRVAPASLVPGLPRLKVNSINPADMAALEERLKINREVILRRMFELDGSDQDQDVDGLTREQMRQIARRASRTLSQIASEDPRFELMAEYAASKRAEHSHDDDGEDEAPRARVRVTSVTRGM